jgi:AcrR family transcriptional regulator
MAEHDRIAKMRRPYQLRARADAMDRTRARITQAAIELHGSIGPAATTMSAVAERAGVTRATLYRHFPNEEILFRACSAEWRSANPRPIQLNGQPFPIRTTVS